MEQRWSDAEGWKSDRAVNTQPTKSVNRIRSHPDYTKGSLSFWRIVICKMLLLLNFVITVASRRRVLPTELQDAMLVKAISGCSCDAHP